MVQLFLERLFYMPTRTQLFPAIERVLQASLAPMDCTELFAMPEIKKHATTVARVSDYLGNLWRRNAVLRLPAHDANNSRSHWCYQWNTGQTPDLTIHIRQKAQTFGYLEGLKGG